MKVWKSNASVVRKGDVRWEEQQGFYRNHNFKATAIIGVWTYLLLVLSDILVENKTTWICPMHYTTGISPEINLMHNMKLSQ